MEKQKAAAKQALIEWLADERELGKAPAKIEWVHEFDLHELHYYVFKFKKSLFSEWLLGVAGGFEANSLEHCGHVFSELKKYDAKTAVEDSIQIVEGIRAYWMQQAKQAEIQEGFKANLKYISQSERNVDTIERQFVKTESRYFLRVGEVDCPSGQIIVADPLCYLAADKFCPQLALTVPAGTYPAEVSIYRNPDIGIRMCTARLKIKATRALSYQLAQPTEESAAAKSKEGVLSGFPVDAGMMAFCDVQTAKEYQQFLDHWHQEHPEGNHYDDYFASYFAQSYQQLPAYQREGGDFIEWTPPGTHHKMVMIASGFGDGFYQCYWGYDENNEICELIVPMINPDLFE